MRSNCGKGLVGLGPEEEVERRWEVSHWVTCVQACVVVAWARALEGERSSSVGGWECGMWWGMALGAVAVEGEGEGEGLCVGLDMLVVAGEEVMGRVVRSLVGWLWNGAVQRRNDRR